MYINIIHTSAQLKTKEIIHSMQANPPQNTSCFGLDKIFKMLKWSAFKYVGGPKAMMMMKISLRR